VCVIVFRSEFSVKELRMSPEEELSTCQVSSEFRADGFGLGDLPSSILSSLDGGVS